MWKWFHQLASPPHFYRISAVLSPWLAVPGLALIAYAGWQGLFVVPMDYQQGDAFRIIYVHVPSAYLSLMAYMIMATSGAIGLIWRIKLAHAVAAAAAPLALGLEQNDADDDRHGQRRSVTVHRNSDVLVGLGTHSIIQTNHLAPDNDRYLLRVIDIAIIARSLATVRGHEPPAICT